MLASGAATRVCTAKDAADSVPPAGTTRDMGNRKTSRVRNCDQPQQTSTHSNRMEATGVKKLFSGKSILYFWLIFNTELLSKVMRSESVIITVALERSDT